MNEYSLDHLVARARGEYLEMPGLSLTVPQAGRLLGVDPTASRQLLDTLVSERFLTVSRTGAFIRQGNGRS